MINNFEAPAIAIESANRTIRPVKGMSGYGSGVSTVSSMILPLIVLVENKLVMLLILVDLILD